MGHRPGGGPEHAAGMGGFGSNGVRVCRHQDRVSAAFPATDLEAFFVLPFCIRHTKRHGPPDSPMPPNAYTMGASPASATIQVTSSVKSIELPEPFWFCSIPKPS